ncbi:TetR/AcrR family transcriptional regulator [Aquicoccus sp. G2-2]|jgi:AcrR family transcriptional regulator|uniref:TetR/AcrR family transcriptional regulator n=1 Tax=Aquicoccus sp. G2-2 TaxID=3092120 RepID=UPI00366B684E
MQAAILDSAEFIFAEHGFAGARMRDIAARSDVNQALINYYFRSKRQLFDQVFRRHGSIVTEQREKLLDALMARDGKPTVPDLVTAYLTPQWDMKFSGPRGAAFVKLQARLHAEPEEQAIRLRREIYDHSTKRYLQALCLALPHLPVRTVSLRMAFLIGTYLFMLNDLGRIDDLSDNRISEVGKDEMMNNLVLFLSAGLQAPLDIST